MDTSKFSNSRDEFPILDFIAQFEAKTETSILFSLGRWGDTLTLADSEPIKLRCRSVFTVFVWADVHHPCHGHIKTGIRARLSDDLMVFESQHDFIHAIFDALLIPRDETYDASFICADKTEGIQQPVDRDGMPDRL
ncbi:MAG: hypothetical protein CMJ78_07170 [Planctomycetaceae bacterium]|nr:hypothetical protein [Planctomycetaceae bacterium]